MTRDLTNHEHMADELLDVSAAILELRLRLERAQRSAPPNHRGFADAVQMTDCAANKVRRLSDLYSTPIRLARAL